ncbi:MAG TPA: GNAT family N-acetyltransferase, partial [Armatimonadota bacterium]|nr:GNAT family N-acetyltransferase [Armatimonadota bacterium]
QGKRTVARLSFQLVTGMRRLPAACGLIGHYGAVDADAGVGLLKHAAHLLRAKGAVRLLGPMNGGTWGSYRLTLPDGACRAPFLMEPWNPADYPEHFLRAGFSVAAEYESRIVEAFPVERARSKQLAERLGRAGVSVAPLQPARMQQELEALFPLCEEAFAQNPYYRPISRLEFITRYSALQPLIDPELVRIARGSDGRVLAVVLALPDHLARAAGSPPRVVLKTLASAPEVRRLGLGAHLADEIHRIAHEKGYRAVIHALMHVSNESMRLSARYGSRVFRRYALYERSC